MSRELTYAEAIREAIDLAMARDERPGASEVVDAIRRLLDRQFRAWVPAALIAHRLGQDDLTLGGHHGRQFRHGGHGGPR